MKINENQRPLISIVIPTRNRFDYVKSAITSILDVYDPRIELVIQDNSDSEVLKFWIDNNIDDVRLKYNYSDLPLSFVGNFSEGVETSTGEYICIIGDDDGINPEIINATAWLKKENIDCLSIKNIVNYVWPNSGIPATVFTKITDGNLTISAFSGDIVKINPLFELELFVNDGCVNYLNFNLPKLYHGIVRRECLQEVKNKLGVYFVGLSPDISISVSLACVVKNAAITDYPLTIPGVCGVSASVVEGLLKKNSKKLEDAPHFRNRGTYHWNNLVPSIYCVETIWADSGIAALSLMGRLDLVNKIKLYKLCAYVMESNNGVAIPTLNGFFKGIVALNQNKISSLIQFVFFLSFLRVKSFFKFSNRIYIRFLIFFKLKATIRIEGLKTIVDASKSLTIYLNNNGHNFTKCIEQSDYLKTKT
jgi:glycosyltransferase involved in cell wall biosynthesis